jgi:hypothetical protein
MKQLFDRERFLAERLRVVRALDPALFRAYLLRWGERAPAAGAEGDYICLVSMHKARTAMRDLPMPERTASKRWLLARGHGAMDGGEVPG